MGYVGFALYLARRPSVGRFLMFMVFIKLAEEIALATSCAAAAGATSATSAADRMVAAEAV